MYFSNINLGQYFPADSFIHRLDPRAKLFALIILISAVFSIKSSFILACWIFILIFIVHVSKIPFKTFIKSSKPILFIIILTFIFNFIPIIYGDSFLKALSNAVFTSTRLFILMMYALLLPLTTAPLELAAGIEALLKPLEKFGFPAGECAIMIGMALRFIPMLMHETDKIIKAQLSRGAKLDQGNLFKKLLSFIPVLIPLFIIIFRRADEIAIAMEARGYSGAKGRTKRKPLKWKLSDSAAIIFSVIPVLLLYLL